MYVYELGSYIRSIYSQQQQVNKHGLHELMLYGKIQTRRAKIAKAIYITF